MWKMVHDEESRTPHMFQAWQTGWEAVLFTKLGNIGVGVRLGVRRWEGEVSFGYLQHEGFLIAK